MPGYAALLAQALAPLGAVLSVERHSLAFAAGDPVQWPRALRERFRLLTIMREAARTLPSVTADLVHVVDGSHAHVAHWIRPGVPFVVTAHDLIPLLQMHGRFPVAPPGFAARWVIGRSLDQLRRASTIVAVSESTKADLVRETAIDEPRIRVIPSALNPLFARALLDPWVAPPEVSGAPFILHVGNNGFYKNREGVLRIFAQVRQQVHAQLVIAGAPADRRLVQLASDTGFGGDVTFVENPTDERIVQLYRSASLLLFPSLYEGFGWPPLEAMACGCPVVCSSAASLPEVVGDAALMAVAADDDAMARLCLRVLREPTMAENLRQRGRARAATFTTERMGRQLMEAYEEVLGPLGG